MRYGLVIKQAKSYEVSQFDGGVSSHVCNPSWARKALDCSGVNSRKVRLCGGPFVFAIEGWSWSKSADAVWESIDDWVASAANEEVVSWYLHNRILHQRACAKGRSDHVQSAPGCQQSREREG